ncbi:MAG: YceH family protein [Desulfuromonadaceae bacterium]|nr:YceH family protein [Desulfuromonadaceae bacterium]MDD2856982.1 YceH family protein [Desulfuromonadaceae bacterium]
MDILLNEVEVRVLGSLIEKEMTTPEYYPLSLNSLTNACNQKSNRDPVTTLSEEDVVRAVDSLRFKQLSVISADGGRVPKYRHLLAEKLGLMPAEQAIISELLLRGPQTLGELRTRCERMHPFTTLSAVEEVLKELATREIPLVTLLPRQPGRKEGRYIQLFSGIPDTSKEEHEPNPEAARLRVMLENDRITKLEEELAELRSEVIELGNMMNEFKKQFE